MSERLKNLVEKIKSTEPKTLFAKLAPFMTEIDECIKANIFTKADLARALGVNRGTLNHALVRAAEKGEEVRSALAGLGLAPQKNDEAEKNEEKNENPIKPLTNSKTHAHKKHSVFDSISSISGQRNHEPSIEEIQKREEAARRRRIMESLPPMDHKPLDE